jgi:hypothetical protein
MGLAKNPLLSFEFRYGWLCGVILGGSRILAERMQSIYMGLLKVFAELLTDALTS